MFDIAEFLNRQIDWSKKTFGEGKRTVGVCNHIRAELAEIEQNPSDLEEWIDVIILALDGAWRTGATVDTILGHLQKKQDKNINERTWGPTPPEDEPSFHLED